MIKKLELIQEGMKMRSLSVLMLASVAMILVAIGMGNAFAYTYSGEFVTVLPLDNNVAITYHSGDNIPVDTGDNLRWYNGFKNMHTDDATVDVTQNTNPSGGLDTTPPDIVRITGLSIPHTAGTDPGIIDQPVEYNVASDGSHTINAYHEWHYGGIKYTSPVDDLMLYY